MNLPSILEKNLTKNMAIFDLTIGKWYNAGFNCGICAQHFDILELGESFNVITPEQTPRYIPVCKSCNEQFYICKEGCHHARAKHPPQEPSNIQHVIQAMKLGDTHV